MLTKNREINNSMKKDIHAPLYKITCFHCGCKIDRTDFYCRKCGKSLAKIHGK